MLIHCSSSAATDCSRQAGNGGSETEEHHLELQGLLQVSYVASVLYIWLTTNLIDVAQYESFNF